ncbi:MAG TPA: hypothetical protein VGO66_05045 [Solirubrobacterales bacterium]|jgi:hypothetical protein|nr:hypothetical protein [Solirubrobacterales bacterium]
MDRALLTQFATAAGLMAACIAVGGFVFHAGLALRGAAEPELRQLTAAGGLCGLAFAMFLVVLSALVE